MKITGCKYNMDTGCVEVKFSDGSMLSIDCIAVEHEYADNRFERSELLNWFVYYYNYDRPAAALVTKAQFSTRPNWAFCNFAF